LSSVVRFYTWEYRDQFEKNILINKTSGLLGMFLITQSWRIPKSEELFNWLTFGKWALWKELFTWMWQRSQL